MARGLFWEARPLAPWARIMPVDQTAKWTLQVRDFFSYHMRSSAVVGARLTDAPRAPCRLMRHVQVLLLLKRSRHTSSQWIARKQLQRIAYIHKDVHKDIQSHAHLSLCAHFHSLACAKIVGFLTYPIWTNLPNLSTLWKYIPEICLGLLNLQFQMSQQPQIQQVSGNTRCCSWTGKASIQPDLLIVELQVEAQLNIGPIPPS